MGIYWLLFSVQLQAHAGPDTTLALSQGSTPTQLPLRGSADGSNIRSWSWKKVSGGAVRIEGGNSQNAVASGFQPGEYAFELTVSDGSSQSRDVVHVRVVDYQKKGEAPCRSGAPKVWTLQPTVRNTIFYPYLRRGGFDIQGGDTIKIPRNPGNDGVYTGISLGDFGGSDGCPVVVVPEETVTISGPQAFFRVGSGAGDSNFVSHVIIDGSYLRKQGVRYGFQFINPEPSPRTIGFTGNLVTDLEVRGLYLQNTGVGVMTKLGSDSAKPWLIFDNYRMKHLKFHDIYIYRTTGEAMYLGHTSPQGDGRVQKGNHGPTVRIDSIEVSNVLIDSAGWDGIQVSNAIYASIHDNIVLRSGTSNIGSQRAWIIMGGNTTGKIYNNVGFNLKEGIRGTPYGRVEIYNNFGDSIQIGGNSDDAIYMTGIPTGPGTNVLEPRAAFVPDVHDNIFGHVERLAMHFPDYKHLNQQGQIQNNDLIDERRPVDSLIAKDGHRSSNNRAFKSFPVKIRSTGTVSMGPRLEVQQGDATRNFTNAASLLAWLKCRLHGDCSTR